MTPPKKRPPLRISVPPDPMHWQDLGHFIETFAEVEANLFYYFTLSCKIPIGVSRVILAGTRTDQMITYLRNLWSTDSEHHPEKDEMDAVLTQLQAINTARGLLVHHASRSTDGGDRISSDIVRTARVDRPRETSASAETLRAMTADLERISLHLVVFMLDPEGSREERLRNVPALGDAWQYKGPQGPRRRPRKSR